MVVDEEWGCLGHTQAFPFWASQNLSGDALGIPKLEPQLLLATCDCDGIPNAVNLIETINLKGTVSPGQFINNNN